MKSTYIIFFIVIFSIVGCSDFLDDEIQYIHEEEIVDFNLRSRGLLDGIYTDYAFDYWNDFSLEYLTSDGVQNSSETPLATGYWGPTDNPYEYVWQQSYDNIRKVTEYIEKVHNMNRPYLPAPGDSLENERTINRYYGEAHFLKAWAEWNLLKVFGGESSTGEMLGFPIVNEVLPDEEYANLSRNTYEECVNQIMEDLDTSIEFLPLEYSGSTANNPGYSDGETGRASGLAAYALKAKVALYAASPAFNTSNDVSKWERAANLAKEFIDKNGGLKALKPYDYSREDNPDQIWRLRNSRQNNSLENQLYPPSLYGQGSVNPSQNLVDAFPDANGYPIDAMGSTFDQSMPYANRDNRFYRFIFYNQDTCFNGPSCSDFAPLEIYAGGKDYYGGLIPDVGTRTGYYLKKFLNNLDFDPSAIDAVTNQPKVYVLLDLSDLYLIYAEALNEAYGQPNMVPAGFEYSAKEALGMIRKRAGFGEDPYLEEAASESSSFRKLLKNERRIELCFSGERFNDLRRWEDIISVDNVKGVLITKSGGNSFSYEIKDVEKRNYEPKNYYLPLPYTELLINKNLQQNKGWE